MCCCGKFFFPHQGPQLVATSPGLTSGIQKKKAVVNCFPASSQSQANAAANTKPVTTNQIRAPFRHAHRPRPQPDKAQAQLAKAARPPSRSNSPIYCAKESFQMIQTHFISNVPPGRQGVGIGHWGETVESRTTRRISIFCECLSSIPCPLERFICTPLP